MLLIHLLALFLRFLVTGTLCCWSCFSFPVDLENPRIFITFSFASCRYVLIWQQGDFIVVLDVVSCPSDGGQGILEEFICVPQWYTFSSWLCAACHAPLKINALPLRQCVFCKGAVVIVVRKHSLEFWSLGEVSINTVLL